MAAAVRSWSVSPGRAATLVQCGRRRGGLLDGDGAGGEGVADRPVPQQVAGLPDPAGGIGAGEPEPVTQPADQVGCAGAGLQVPLVGLAQQQPLQHGRVRLHLEHGGDRGLDLLVRQLPHLVCSHHGRAGQPTTPAARPPPGARESGSSLVYMART